MPLAPKTLISICFILTGVSLQAQQLLPQKGKEPGFHPKFNKEFVQSHRIKEIKVEMNVKRDGDKIRPTGDREIYRFSREGKLEMIRSTTSAYADTGFTFYFYAGTRLDCEMKNDASGMFSYCYIYTDDGYIAERKFGRTERFEQIERAADPRELPEISTEKYTYRRYENQVHGTLYNSANRPYQNETWYYDENGYLTQYLKSFVMSSGREKETYSYNEQGWLAARTVEIDRTPYSWEYIYDKVGNLIEEQKFQDENELHHKEFVYDPKTFILKAELSREDKQAQIRIVNYSYTYY